MTNKILIDVPPIHDDGLKAFEGIPDIEIVRYDRANQSLEDAIKDVDAVMVGLAIFDEKILNTDEAMSRMAVMAAKEILKVLDGEKPLNVINPEIYL